MTYSIPRGSVEYIETQPITGSVPLDMPIELSLSRGGTHDWRPAVWVGDVGTERRARTSDVVDTTALEDTNYTLMARLTDNPEVPIIAIGAVHISG